jgi:2',3'-cyclic-nucleotide 2'-phosphodiesterase (5'-nucleotidase family)
VRTYIAETKQPTADASVHELELQHLDVDFTCRCMTRPSNGNWVFKTATPGTPAQMKISDMFTLMPYENSLVVLSMNGPQLKAVLERAYRNYYYYKYVPGYGGYSYYTTCMIDINAGGQITYLDLYNEPYDPAKEYVVSLVYDGHQVTLVMPTHTTTFRQ